MQLGAKDQMGPHFRTKAKHWVAVAQALFVHQPNVEGDTWSKFGVYTPDAIQYKAMEMVDRDQKGKVSRFIRFIFAFLTNGIAWDIIYYTFPILLLGAQGEDAFIDFVKDSFAVVFIAQLDNLDPEETSIVTWMPFVSMKPEIEANIQQQIIESFVPSTYTVPQIVQSQWDVLGLAKPEAATNGSRVGCEPDEESPWEAGLLEQLRAPDQRVNSDSMSDVESNTPLLR